MEFRASHAAAKANLSDRPKQHSTGVEPAILPGNAGDHGMVRDFLRFMQGGPASEDFGNWLDEPTYEPTDRLLVHWGERLAGHVHLLHRVASFDGVSMPVACLVDFAVLPELHDTVWERSLLGTAERAAGEGQAVLAMARTTRPELFSSNGWLPSRGQGHSRANTHKILSQLAGESESSIRRPPRLEVRLWRHLELDALCKAYRSFISDRWGGIERLESYWHWLVGRKVHDALLICVECSGTSGDEGNESRIVGCAITRGSQILEVLYLPTHPLAGKLLLARACRDAIEQDFHHVSLEAPADEPVHQCLIQAEGQWHSENGANGERLVVKLLAPQRWVEAMFPVFDRRAAEAHLPRPLALRFDDGGHQYRLTLNRSGSRFARTKTRGADVRCTADSVNALMLGNVDVPEAIASGEITAANAEVGRALAALFPPRLFSPSPFDIRRF